jgi:CheY-like chemotaxis protein
LSRKILLADDSVTAQNMGRRILSDAGYDVTTVNNGSAALKKIAESKPDLIVLDVYMPGYGGLEVCQRLREAPETARIPVLLTVGKLEPFKADEARRVRADGFIVKPFEASELLTALTKLEDKIVPQSQPTKPSRFAKALAGADEFASGKEFGDSETGWKNRLSIPPPHSKHRESASVESPAATVHEAAGSEEPKPAEMKSGLEEALLSSMPQDVTAEEIAAIKAAAAAFSAAPGEDSVFRPQARDRSENQSQERVSNTPEIAVSDVKAEALPAEAVASAENANAETSAENRIAATFASGSEHPAEMARENISAVTQAESSATPEQTRVVDAVSPGEVPAETPPPAMVAESPATKESPAETGKLGDEEVTAALASLAPSNGHGDAAAIDREVAKSDLAARDRAPMTMAAAVAGREFNGPRWIAESVAVMEDEATLVLEQEMERAYAAFAAADAARMSPGNPPAEPSASMVGTQDPANNSESSSSAVESLSNSGGVELGAQEPMSPPAVTHSEEPSAAGELTSAAASPAVDAVAENSVPEVKENAAYAAAASAGSSTEPTPATESVSQMVSSESAPAAAESAERHGEPELAAAWANWRQIRESVVGSQLSSQIADTVAELKESRVEAQPESRPDLSPATAEESSEIANIVDSVLADLKPKLMAEIARKMGKDPKKK